MRSISRSRYAPTYDTTQVDDYYSTLDNAYAQINYARFQSCGQYNFPDMLTIGQGAQTDAEYRTQVCACLLFLCGFHFVS